MHAVTNENCQLTVHEMAKVGNSKSLCHMILMVKLNVRALPFILWIQTDEQQEETHFQINHKL